MSEYIEVWKDAPGQQIKTVVDANGEPVRRNFEYVKTHDLTLVLHDATLELQLSKASGEHLAIAPELARTVLGWDV